MALCDCASRAIAIDSEDLLARPVGCAASTRLQQGTSMRLIRLSSLLALPCSIAAAEPAGKLDASVALGGHVFSSQSELGVGDRMDEPGALSSGTIGARIALA